ncbi:hypothetical protein ACWCQW_43935 [Streptomyces mirabilis]
MLSERVVWAVDLVSGMAADLLGTHWNTTDVDVLASGEDAGGRKLPSNAWMALRRLGWTVGPDEGDVRRPGDAGHPPPPGLRVRRASVRRDTLTRAGPGCLAQPIGTRA